MIQDHSIGSRCIKGTDESLSIVDLSVPLNYNDPSDIDSLILIQINQKERTLDGFLTQAIFHLPRQCDFSKWQPRSQGLWVWRSKMAATPTVFLAASPLKGALSRIFGIPLKRQKTFVSRRNRYIWPNFVNYCNTISLSITRTFKGNPKKFRLAGVRVGEQIGNK